MTQAAKGAEKAKKVRQANVARQAQQTLKTLKQTVKKLDNFTDNVKKLDGYNRKDSILKNLQVIRQSLDADMKEQANILIRELTK